MDTPNPCVTGIILVMVIDKIIPDVIDNPKLEQIIDTHLKKYAGITDDEIRYFDKKTEQFIMFKYQSLKYTIARKIARSYYDRVSVSITFTLTTTPTGKSRAIAFLNHLDEKIVTWCEEYAVFVRNATIYMTDVREKNNMSSEPNIV